MRSEGRRPSVPPCGELRDVANQSYFIHLDSWTCLVMCRVGAMWAPSAPAHPKRSPCRRPRQRLRTRSRTLTRGAGPPGIP